MSADSKDNKPFRFRCSLRIVLRISQAGKVDGGLAVDLFLRPEIILNTLIRQVYEKFIFFLKMGHSRPLFLYFRLFNSVDSKYSI